MSAGEDSSTLSKVVTVLAVGLVALAAVLLVIGGHAEILDKSLGGSSSGMGKLNSAIQGVKPALNWIVGAAVPLGLAGGGVVMATGNRQGMKVMGTSAGAGACVLAGNGLAAVVANAM